MDEEFEEERSNEKEIAEWIITESKKRKINIKINSDGDDVFSYPQEGNKENKDEAVSEFEGLLLDFEPGLYFLKGYVGFGEFYSHIMVSGLPGQCGAVVITEVNSDSDKIKERLNFALEFVEKIGYSRVYITLTNNQIKQKSMIKKLGFEQCDKFVNKRTNTTINLFEKEL